MRPNDPRPLPAFRLKVVVEVVSPGSRKADKLDKMAEYADAGIPFYWLAWLSDDHVLSIDVHVLDHTLGYYRLFRTLTPRSGDQHYRRPRQNPDRLETTRSPNPTVIRRRNASALTSPTN
jgi:hypothetical protein